jgi:N12 class adenine-specific DNA methylase
MTGPDTEGETMKATQLALQFDAPARTATFSQPIKFKEPRIVAIATGEKGKAQDILAAIRTLKKLERLRSLPDDDEARILTRFPGFGPVALSIFPDPVTGKFKDVWKAIGEELRELLTPEEYESAKRTTFCQFFTSPAVMMNIHAALINLGIQNGAKILEPGCGIGNFMRYGSDDYNYIGVELDSISGRIARLLNPQADIRIENFRDTRLPPLDAVIGNVPFANISLELGGNRFSLHDYFMCKSVDALKPGGILAVVTSHFSLDRQNGAAREYLAGRADFLGALRLPGAAFKNEGTAVVTDIVFLRKRAPGEAPHHADPDWLSVEPLEIDGVTVPVNKYFLKHSEQVLGTWSRKDTLYGEGYSVTGNGDLSKQLKQAIDQLPAHVTPDDIRQVTQTEAERPNPPPFTLPPLEHHITEGSFLIDDHRVIRQIIDGKAEPVVYGGKTLTAHNGMTGRRLAALIGLRDKARRVLQSQNEGWPEEARNEARRELSGAYDRFVFAYGPINKTTISETKDGGVIRRMPNVVKFREDPDAMLVMALEEYDEETDTAKKAAIMSRDVVGKHEPITKVTSAEEGLLVSLDRKGGVDLAFISELYGRPEAAILEALGDLIYRDPVSQTWQTADEYLSGNVRDNLRQAEAAGPEYQRNAEALKAVQPEDVLPGDIDANLGAPWIPVSDIQAFAAELFSCPSEALTIRHIRKDAAWSVEAGYSAEHSVAATTDYGTSRINGITLFEQALNMKTPTIYDTFRDGDREEKVVNQEETLAAREKQKLIKEKFKSWIFSDPDRAERLVRIYNDTYNNLRPRLFDGSHLAFPGMSEAFHLRQHQKDAAWRGMSSGNTLLAHCVGAGKSALMAATGMKMKQAGLIKKPLFVVPNHLLEQFAREFLHVYPNAHVLVAAKEDFTRERRKHLTAKISTGDWDAIITTHSSFERVGMSRDYQQRFLQEQIDEYENLIIDNAAEKGDNRNIIKNLEKQKAAFEEKLKNLMAEDKKDDGLTFDELGVDHIFIDELQYFKNLATPTKMDRVAGINTGGSERAFDLYMKCRYLDQLHPGHGITGATGTPVSNSMVEMFNMQRYLDPAGLKSRGLDHFDAWAATFGEVVEAMEISPDGKTLKPRSRFAKFVNLPELLMMFRSFADVQTPDDLKLPTPKLKGGKPQTIACPMSDQQKELQDELVERYEAIRNTKVDPRIDNALKITTDGRKLALDGRMLSPDAGDFPGSKINALVENVASIWRETADKRSAQMIFCDISVNPTPWGYSAYDDVITKLVKAGIPRQEIASIGDADTDAKKRALFEKVRAGQVRVLIGSTTKMGTGTNVQKRLIALHHLDAPWKPAEVEQRDGRILRQGNENPEVAIYRYVTERSFDSYMWQTLETKARFINQIMSGKSAVRQADDIGSQELSFAEVKAIASGNPAVLVLAETDAEIQRLSILRKNHLDEQFVIRRRLRDLPGDIQRMHKRAAGLKTDIATLKAHPDHAVTLGGRTLHGDDAVIALSDRLDSLPLSVSESRYIDLGNYRGLKFGVVLHPMSHPDIYLQGDAVRHADIRRDARGLAVLNALNRLARGYEESEQSARQELALAESQLRDFQARQGAAFPHESYLKEMSALREQLRMALSGAEAKEGESATEIAGRIKALRSQNSVEPAPQREARAIAAEEPVTARIRRRAGEKVNADSQGEAEVNHADKWQRKLAEETRANAERVREPG